jgi:drug/metabolite transporter (DMT)-like permease
MTNILYFTFCALFWGGSFIAIKFTVDVVPSFHSAFYRVFLATIFLIILNFKRFKIPSLSKVEWYLILKASLFSIGIPFSLLFWGEQFIPGAIAGVINGTVPIWTLLVGVYFFSSQRKLEKSKLLGIIIGFLGLFMIFLPKLNLKGEINEVYGMISVLGMAISYGIGINLNNRVISIFDKINSQTNLIVQQGFSALFILIISLFFNGIPDLSLLNSPKVITSILYLSFFSTALAYILFYKLIMNIGTVRASTVTFFVPIIAMGLDALITGFIPGKLQIIGAMIILLSLYFLKKDDFIKN